MTSTGTVQVSNTRNHKTKRLSLVFLLQGMMLQLSVRRPVNKDSHVKNSVSLTLKTSERTVLVYVKKNKQTNTESVVQIVLWIVDSGCLKLMMGERSLLKNFIEKFMGTIHFRNDNFAAITEEKAKKASRPQILVQVITCQSGLLSYGFMRSNQGNRISDNKDEKTKPKNDRPHGMEKAVVEPKFKSKPKSKKAKVNKSQPNGQLQKVKVNTEALNEDENVKWAHPYPSNGSDSADFNGNLDFVPYNTPNHEEIESYTAALEPSNVQTFHQVQPSTHIWTKDHPLDQVIGDPSKPVMTRQKLQTDSEVCMYALTVSTIKPKNIKEAMVDHSWIESMQDKLNQFERLKVRELVPRPEGKNIIALKWLWKNNMMLKNIVGKNKTQEVYVSQPEGFIDPEFPDHVYRLKKALYGLKQAPRAWYDKLSSFLIQHGFTKGIVDPTLFTRRHGEDILLVQVYVDDIIFGSTNPDFSKRFANLMKNNFEMSMMGELKFFLGLQVHQSPRGIFISQSQYAIELLKKHGLDECVSMSTPMATERLDADLQGTPTDQTTYRRMIGGLMYLTASRPDIAYATFVCARYQARPTVKHLKEDSGFELIAYSDADHAGCKDDYKSTSGGLQFLDYGYKYNRIPVYCDSKSAIAISCNPVQHSKTKHIDIWYHFINKHVEKGSVELYFVGTEYQLADLFTKALPKERFEYLVHRIVIIMAHQQHAADVHPDELCPPNKRYDLMDANKKIDFEHVQCPPESKLLTNIIKNHPLRFSIAASSSVPWIYMAQFWHTLNEDGSKYRLTFMLDKKELSLTLDDFRTIFHLPQATDNNHDSFVPPPSFLDMVPFYKHELGFTMELKTSSSFKITSLL
ncbi:retrovirus-related pol polyprotein from transposon TNT 1-94 [Tanacetum coccineum]